ncbi:YigZ family protein [Candidatus Gracilibacteria bacterium 28_42_T64]|nr:YigZ family protein [Candidatus Gracilibacteria bacterium 28_42_T64]
MTNKLSLNLGGSKKPNFRRKIMQNVIIDRKSKYTVIGGYIESSEEVKPFIKELLKDKYFQKSTHNTYAYRLELENGSILEGKNDDGEVGAGNCILRELQRDNCINTIVVVTRYFGGIHLQADRFKNVIDATKIILHEF